MYVASSPDRRLDLKQLMSTLLAQGRLQQEGAEQALIAHRQATRDSTHPLVFLAEQQLHDLHRPGQTLDIETLTAWLAEQCEQPYLRIDPLKIEVTTVTALMSFAFAQRHKILAIAADEHAVTIASAQPYVCGWEADLTHALKRPVKRVIANPLEIERLSLELFTLAKSVNGAALNDQKTNSTGNL